MAWGCGEQGYGVQGYGASSIGCRDLPWSCWLRAGLLCHCH